MRLSVPLSFFFQFWLTFLYEAPSLVSSYPTTKADLLPINQDPYLAAEANSFGISLTGRNGQCSAHGNPPRGCGQCVSCHSLECTGGDDISESTNSYATFMDFLPRNFDGHTQNAPLTGSNPSGQADYHIFNAFNCLGQHVGALEIRNTGNLPRIYQINVYQNRDYNNPIRQINNELLGGRSYTFHVDDLDDVNSRPNTHYRLFFGYGQGH